MESWNSDILGSPGFIYMSKLKRLKKYLQLWNWNTFVDVTKKLKQVEEDVMKATLLSDRNPLDLHLLNKLVTLRGQQEVLLDQQKAIIQQKSRVKWLKEGAANTRFFRINLKVRQTQNSIVELEKQEGGITSNQEEITDILVKHFEDKFTFQEVSMATNIFNDIPEVVTEEENYMIEAIPNADEIREVVFDLNPDSAPGPDAFAVWLYREVKNAKRENQFRPIGLMNFSFKVITKIITKRLTEIIKKVVSPQQSAFIKGRNIQEKIALTSELVNDLEHKRRGGNMGLKLDITQAYDSLSWEFMFQVMQKLGFSSNVTRWLHTLLKSAKISVLLNGSLVGYFQVSRWLRQGDPLSPLLFVIAEDLLSRTLTRMVQDNQIQPMITRKNVHPSHIFFVDDIFISAMLISEIFPIYTMAVYKWPRTIIKECERIIRNFLWTGDPSSRKVITIKWDSVCSPIDEGGIGLRRLEILNKSLLMKLYWKILNGDDEMSIYFQAKYQDRNGDWIQYYRKSFVWPGMQWVANEVLNHSRWLVGKGESISVWKEKWIKDKSLLDLFPENSFMIQFPNMKVSDILLDGAWVIPTEMLVMFGISELPVVDNQEDKRVWIPIEKAGV
ncbi:uncharacterized protein LOC113352259 [Papaver somniferum]|uniref:uncharacterized protein LOC113352259 n=1 Tax=Papaver somniferum TaxID=3469 RepID=UPI000E6FB940|nr:uncharacterized protein LOC113352259 [Papaver somniferum]